MNDKAKPQVGDIVYIHDVNRRVYDEHRRMIVRKSWYEATITKVGRSIVYVRSERGTPEKVGYRIDTGSQNDNYGHRHLVFSKKEMDDEIFINEHRHRISSAASACRSADVLRQVAELLGLSTVSEQ